MEEIKINEEKENLLFNRKEISFNIRREQTPSRAEVLDIVAEKFSTPKENIKIKNIGGRFGSKDFNVNVFIYNSEEDKNRVEIKKKKDAIPETPKEAEPVGVKDEEKHEEKVEEVKAEEKVEAPTTQEEVKPAEESEGEVKPIEEKVEAPPESVPSEDGKENKEGVKAD